MAAYAATVTTKQRGGIKIDAVVGLHMFVGEVDITNYNPTRAEITGITGKFKGDPFVVIAGTSDLGYIFEWVDADKAFKAYFFDYNAAGDGAAIEAPVDTDVGAAHFVAIGIG